MNEGRANGVPGSVAESHQNLNDLAGFLAFYARNLCGLPPNIRVRGHADHDLGMAFLDMRLARDGYELSHRWAFTVDECLFSRDLEGLIRYRVEEAKLDLWQGDTAMTPLPAPPPRGD